MEPDSRDEGALSPGLRTALRAAVIAAGVAAALASLRAFRLDDWPIYVTFVLLSLVLYRPYVEVLPALALPMPGLALVLGFLYVGGGPIVILHAVAPLTTRLVRGLMPERWRARLPPLRAGGTAIFARDAGDAALAIGEWADWGAFTIGLATRWGIVSLLVPEGRAAGHPGAIIAAELGGYLVWSLQSSLPIFSFRPVLPAAAEERVRAAAVDLGLIMLFALTPFVFLITYGYTRHGLPGAVAWSLSALGLHFMLKRLNEQRVTVEEQNRRLEALNRELEHRERLSAIGKMSSVVSHQMLQQLGVIGLHADLIRNAEAGGDPAAAVARARANAAAIEEALEGVNRVLTDLLVFSRDLRLNLYEHSLRRVLEESVDACRPQAAERGVALRLECGGEPTVTLDKLKVRQAVVNVLRNAIDASPRGGDVLVEGGVRDGWARIAVSDRGPGVPEADREAVFAPFFTTKEHGTGLGLAIAREFTEAHGGRIAVERRDGAGSTFVLSVPQRPAAA